MRLEYLSLIIIVGWAIVLTVLERLFPYQKGYKIFRKGYWMDLFWYTLVQSYLLGVGIAFLIRTIDTGSSFLHTIDTSTTLAHSSGTAIPFSRLHLIRHWPLLLQILFFLFTHDLWQYWFHRIQHRNKYLWRTHEAAHATPEVDWLVGSRSHALEIIIAQTVEFAPIVLLGASPEVALVKATLDAVWGMYNHSNIRVNQGWLIYFFNGPQLHRWHHHLGTRQGCNFSTKFSIWDWLWHTAHLPRTDERPTYGFRGMENYPVYSYFKQFLCAFRRSK